MNKLERYRQSADYIRERTGAKPSIAVVLGSGLGDYTDRLEAPIQVPYREIPHFPKSHNENHKGVLFAGTLAGRQVLMMSGRFHHYEGYEMEDCAYYVPVFQLLGVETLIVTNAAGGINPGLEQGSLMLISDHIKLTSKSPVMGPEAGGLPGRPRFFDMGDTYTAALRQVALDCANRLGVSLREGVYAFMGGPQYETPAEIRMLERLGADAVGMSTVPEAIMASYCGLRLLGISCVTNMAAGLNDAPLSDDEVRETAARVAGDFADLLTEIVKSI